MQLIGADDDGNIVVLYDSRWAHPECFGYKPDDPQYKFLQQLWMKITGKQVESQPGSQTQKENNDDR